MGSGPNQTKCLQKYETIIYQQNEQNFKIGDVKIIRGRIDVDIFVFYHNLSNLSFTFLGLFTQHLSQEFGRIKEIKI